MRVGGYMKSVYCVTDEKHNGIGIFIERPDNDESINITCKKWESVSIEHYYNKTINLNDLPANSVEYINNIASTMYKQGLIKYNLNKIQEDFE